MLKLRGAQVPRALPAGLSAALDDLALDHLGLDHLGLGLTLLAFSPGT